MFRFPHSYAHKEFWQSKNWQRKKLLANKERIGSQSVKGLFRVTLLKSVEHWPKTGLSGF